MIILPVKKRKTEVRVRKLLKNGQQGNLYFKRRRTFENGFCWYVYFYIGDTKRANMWYNHCTTGAEPITGDGSLTALIWAKAEIEKFFESLKSGEATIIFWSDDRRKNVYLKTLFKEGYVRNENYLFKIKRG